MNKTVDRIRELLRTRNISIRELAKMTDIPPTTMHRYLQLKDDEDELKIPLSKLEAIASVLGTTATDLIGWETDSTLSSLLASNKIRKVKKRKLPLLGNVACGEPTYADLTYDSFVECDGDIKADFCLVAKGDSMINARIFNGDILFVKSQPIVDEGEIAVVLIDDETTVKRVHFERENEGITALFLIPENPTYKSMRYSGENLSRVRILGKVIAGQHRIV